MKSYKIYQLPVEHKAKFMGYEFAQKHNVMPKLEDYNLVWEGQYPYSGGTPLWVTCDDIYLKFNAGRHPEGYKGHSISMSDVIEIDGKYFYCDSFGWEEVSFS